MQLVCATVFSTAIQVVHWLDFWDLKGQSLLP